MTDRVEFRKWRDDNEIFALFPDSPADHKGNVTSYAHIGQHGAADYDHCVDKSIPATPEEFAPLQKELETIGYVLTIDNRCEVCSHLESKVGPLSANKTHEFICDDCIDEESKVTP